jgi:plasmid stabilization system protein ParE
MKLKFTKGFREKLNAQVDFIAKDKPDTARKFKNDLIAKINEMPGMPFKHRKSIFFDREDIRDLVFKGYVAVYKVNQDLKEIEVFGFTKYQENPFKK